MRQKTIKLLVSFALLFSSFLFGGCTSKTKVDPTQYMSVEFLGIDGSALPNIVIDTEKMFTDLHAIDETVTKEEVEGYYPHGTIIFTDPQGAFSNGDICTVKCTYNNNDIKDKKFEFAGPDTVEITVEGLMDHIDLDPFENFDENLHFDILNTIDGLLLQSKAHTYSPLLEFSDNIENRYREFPMNGIKYTADFGNKRFFENGDVLHITAEADQSLTDQKYQLTRTEYDYTLNNAPYYPSTLSEVPVSLWETLQEFTEQDLSSSFDRNSDYKIDGYYGDSYKMELSKAESIDNLQLQNIYLLHLNPDMEKTEMVKAPYNAILMTYSFDATNVKISKWKDEQTRSFSPCYGYYLLRGVAVDEESDATSKVKYIRLSGLFGDQMVSKFSHGIGSAFSTDQFYDTEDEILNYVKEEAEGLYKVEKASLDWEALKAGTATIEEISFE